VPSANREDRAFHIYFTLSFSGGEPYGKADSEMLLPGRLGQPRPDLNLLAISNPDLSATKMIFDPYLIILSIYHFLTNAPLVEISEEPSHSFSL